MDDQFLLIAGAGLAIMIAASVFSRRTGVAAPLLLVALGIGASYLPGTPTITVERRSYWPGCCSTRRRCSCPSSISGGTCR